MRRVIVGLAATAITLLALAGTAGAAQGHVTQIRFSGSFADAAWFTSSASSQTFTVVQVSKAKQGSELFVDKFTAHLDANGDATGYTDTSADVTSGFSFALKQPLASASLSATGLPVTRCRYDANFNLIGCTAIGINMSVGWTGKGPITRGVSSDHFKSDGFSETDHFNGTDRDATATGTVAGLALTAGDLEGAEIGTAKSATITVCKGPGC